MADQAITALPKKTYSGSSKIAATDHLLGIDSAEGYQMLIQDLGEYIINRVTASLAGSNQTLAAAISALNSKTKAYDYTAQSGSFIDWVLSTFTTNGDYYVIYATTNWTGWAGSNTGICKVIRRNNDYYLEAYIADTATATNQSFYINRYTNGSWLGWIKIPSRYEIETLNNRWGVYPQFSRNITSDTVDTITDTGIYEAYFGTGMPFANTWGTFIVIGKGTTVIEQQQICTAGIAIRHFENNSWGSWIKQPTRAEIDALNSRLRVEFVSSNETKTFTVTNPCWIFVNEADDAFFFGMASGSRVNAIKNSLVDVSIARPNNTSISITNNQSWGIRAWFLQF